MMYSFAARADCAVVDEPFYGVYLQRTGISHPMAAQIKSSMPTEARDVVAQITGTNPAQKDHFYQKHMCQHMIEGVDRSWMRNMKNVFLIRHPARVVASYAAKREQPTLEDIGFEQQAMLFDELIALGETPIVIDSFDVRQAPARMLRKLCAALGLVFEPSMLQWPAGGHLDDGVWASHWYGAVHRSTGFAGAEGPLPEVSGELDGVMRAALPYYEHLAQQKISL
jgi:hypothetical protein